MCNHSLLLSCHYSDDARCHTAEPRCLRDTTTSWTGRIGLHNLDAGAPREIWDGRKSCRSLLPAPRCYLCMCGERNHQRTCSTPFCSQSTARMTSPAPATSSRQRRSNHPKHWRVREGCRGIIHATCCWRSTEAPPKSSAIVLERPCAGRESSAGRCFVSGFPPDGAVPGM